MLGALAFVAVGQKKHQPAWLVPLRFRGDQKLVDNDLRTIREVAELCFPENQGQRIGDTVAELKAHGGVLTQQTINELKPRLVRTEVLQRDIAFTRLVIRELEMPLSEGPARYIFAGQADRSAFEHETSECQSLGKSPIDGSALQNFFPLFDKAFQLRMKVEPIGHGCTGVDNPGKRSFIDRCRWNRLVNCFVRNVRELLDDEILAALLSLLVGLVQLVAEN